MPLVAVHSGDQPDLGGQDPPAAASPLPLSRPVDGFSTKRPPAQSDPGPEHAGSSSAALLPRLSWCAHSSLLSLLLSLMQPLSLCAASLWGSPLPQCRVHSLVNGVESTPLRFTSSKLPVFSAEFTLLFLSAESTPLYSALISAVLQIFPCYLCHACCPDALGPCSHCSLPLLKLLSLCVLPSRPWAVQSCSHSGLLLCLCRSVR